MRHASQRLKTMLGVGDDAQIELFNLNVRTWRSSVVGAALLNLAVAWTAKVFSPESSLWTWAVAGWLMYAVGAAACYLLERRQERQQGSDRTEAVLLAVMLGHSFVVGLLWASLPWWLPPLPGIQFVAALAALLLSLASASASVSVGTLMAICLPTLLLVPAALWWHAGQPLAAVLAFGVELLVWRHGLVLHGNLLASIRQRRQLEALSRQVALQQTQLQAAERERGVMMERQRLLRDMHDGIGASLVSALKMTEQGQLSCAGTAIVLQECIDDLRLVIDSLEPVGHDLLALLATLRYRIGSRLAAAGIAIEWAVADVPPLPWLEAPQALEVLRIVQEALTNVLKHSGASRVRVALNHEAGDDGAPVVTLVIEDDGIGFNRSAARAGRGLAHMRLRANKVAGVLMIGAGQPRGTRLSLRLHAAHRP